MRSMVLAVLLGSMGAAVGCAGGAPLGAGPRTSTSTSTSGRVGSHGMVAFGTPGEAYVSHIPMFGPPHDVQAVVAGSFAAAPGGTLPATLSDRLYTFVPDKMSLDAFRSGSLGEL